MLAAALCGACAPSPPTAPSAAVVAAEPAAASDISAPEGLALEARWRLREWSAPLWWTGRGGGIALCQAEICNPDSAPIYHRQAALEAAIDDAAARYWKAFCASVEGMTCQGAVVVKTAAYPDTFYGGPRNGVPEILAHVERREQIRDIDMLFWALSEIAVLRHFDAAEGEVPFDLHHYDQLDAELDWLATRYGLTRSGALTYSWDAEWTESVPVARGDLFYGVFARPTGERYACSRDAPPGKYCCGLRCVEIGGEDALEEGH
jgi:hypothetical protein